MPFVQKNRIGGVVEEDWIKDAVASSTGNIALYEEFEAPWFDMFQKYRANGYPDTVIVALMCDVTKLPRTVPTLFDKWRSQQCWTSL